MSKREVKSDQQREKIITISREMFAEHGYEATTTRMINQAAGISEGSLYYYFPHGKHEILDTIVYQGIVNRMSQVKMSFSECMSITDVEERLMAIFQAIWRIFQDDENYQSFMITIHERMLLSDNQANWLLKVLDSLVVEIAVKLKQAEPLRKMSDEQRQATAQVIISIFQKVIYDELLIKNTRKLSAKMKASILPQLQIVLNVNDLQKTE
ncbi:TetR/AcrR family transcriptional regulator [Secundilactobacillus folii]|uniref:TetR family transcriptional regulator n=1 Tax=Secundilactobacillus folii TaxID=2678357 RepID=A0A7X2XV52_9LACO|nr:TetR/AcrR family transcriptional regulator [Secundilactobacillus folii]MTV81523.1 TetR family transcriptional regulator [Secundilactobacillus folii]